MPCCGWLALHGVNPNLKQNQKSLILGWGQNQLSVCIWKNDVLKHFCNVYKKTPMVGSLL